MTEKAIKGCLLCFPFSLSLSYMFVLPPPSPPRHIPTKSPPPRLLSRSPITVAARGWTGPPR